MPTTQNTQTQSRNETSVDREFQRSDSEQPSTTALLRKLGQTLENIASITENVSKILDFFPRIINNQCEHSTLTENTDQGRTPCVLATQELTGEITELINETNQPTIERDAQRIKRSIEIIYGPKIFFTDANNFG